MIAGKIQKGDYYISKEVPSLIDISLGIVADNFSLYPSLPNLKVQSIIDKIISRTSLTWPLTVTGPHIEDESYWRRACELRWKNRRPTEHGNSWKQTYVEKHLEEMLEKHPGGNVQNLVDVIMAVRQYVMNLHIEELPSHLDLRILFRNIPCITKLQVSYGAKRLGSEYDRARFGMRMDDAATLSKCIKNAQCLSFLSLPCNIIDDELVKMLVRGLLFNKTIIELDLSHNRIGDHGARRIAKYLFHTELLMSLDLSDNCIQYEGSRCIGQALRSNASLKNLNLKHNRMDDKSGAKLCNDLHQNSTVSQLNLAANMLSIQFTEKLTDLLDTDSALRELDISCNILVDPEAEESIKEENVAALEKLRDLLASKCLLTKLDIRNSGLPNRLEREITDLVVGHELDLRGIPLYKKETPKGSVKEESRAPSRASQQAQETN